MPQPAKRDVLPVNLAFKAEIKKDNAPLRVKQDDRRSVGNANAIPSAHAKGGGMAGRNALADKDGDSHMTADEFAGVVDHLDGHDAHPHLLDWVYHDDL